MTDLFVAGGTAPVPPACRRPPLPLPPVTRAPDGTVVLELPPLGPRTPASRIIPSLSALTGADYSFRFEARVGGGPWVAASPVGPHGFAEAASDGGAPSQDDRLRAEIDVFEATPAATEVRLRVRLQAPDLDHVTRTPLLICVSLSGEAALDEEPVASRARLDVPALSQMNAPEAIRHRICSPACAAMVLGYWKRPVDPVAIAADMFDPRHDIYGVWPAAIRAAARRGVAGYLLRFPSWAAATWCLDQGLPVIASVRYAAGELARAAVAATTGHLLVLTGYDGEAVFVNDPAAPAAREVPRQYELADIRRIWLERSGVGYVLFGPDV